MKEKIINVYEHKDEYYISGFDYSELFNVSMGIDSKTHYYKINIQELRNIVKSNQISYRPMDYRRKFLISEKFYSEVWMNDDREIVDEAITQSEKESHLDSEEATKAKEVVERERRIATFVIF